jgi:hypothetical protein
VGLGQKVGLDSSSPHQVLRRSDPFGGVAKTAMKSNRSMQLSWEFNGMGFM